MPFPGPTPDTPWKLLPPQAGLPYFPYMRSGTPSTYGDTPDGGSRKGYDYLPAVLTGLTASGLMWGASKRGVPVQQNAYLSAFAVAAASRFLYDGLAPFVAGQGVVEGLKTMVTTQPKHTFALLTAGIAAPIAAVYNEYSARRNRRNRR